MNSIDNFTRKDPVFFSTQVKKFRRFSNLKINNKDSNLLLRAGGWERCNREYEVERASFPYYSIEFVSNGLGLLQLNNSSYNLATGSIFTYGPSTFHTITSLAAEPMEKYFITFSIKEDLDIPLLNSKMWGNSVICDSFSTYLTLFEELITIGIENSIYSIKVATAILQVIIYKLLFHYKDEIKRQKNPVNISRQYLRCMNIIKQDALYDNNFNELIARLNISYSYLCRLFKQYMSISPYQYYLTLRMNYAKLLLAKEDLSIRQISDILGYDNQSHFSRTFKNVLGTSPSSSRKRN